MSENTNEAREQFEVPQNMMIYYLRLLKRGPLWTPEETPEVERLQAAHLAYGRKLREGRFRRTMVAWTAASWV